LNNAAQQVMVARLLLWLAGHLLKEYLFLHQLFPGIHNQAFAKRHRLQFSGHGKETALSPIPVYQAGE